MKVRIATRGSELALTQVRLVSAALRAHTPDLEVEEVPVSTRGDRVTDRPLAALGGKGLFVSEVEAMVATGQADLAVHSLKDVPGDVELAEGMELVCIPARESPFDVLLTRDGRSLGELRSGARVGTTSLRRVAQLAAVRGDLVFDTLRGNVGTRLSRLHEGAFDAIVLAAAGLSRLGLLEREPHVVLDADVCLPAVGQGTLAIEAAGARDDLRRLLAPLEDRSARIETTAERAMLKRLEGSCRVPIAGHARFDAASGRVAIEGRVAGLRDGRLLCAGGDRYLGAGAPDDALRAAHALGVEVADALLAQGARSLMREVEADVLRSELAGNGGGDRGPYRWP